jgi:hypothetical protein
MGQVKNITTYDRNGIEDDHRSARRGCPAALPRLPAASCRAQHSISSMPHRGGPSMASVRGSIETITEADAERQRKWEGWRIGQALPKKEYEL